jgi:ArsR family transcriptional regulator, zinc-responsive transcriptional repressor
MKDNPYYWFFGNLANPLKIKIIEELKKKSSTVSELVENIKEEQSKISHSLANLRKCSIVITERKGKNIVYTLNKKTIIPILKIIDDHRETHCKEGCFREK